ncbi:hypothetical protein HII31_00444 [Pseudocercospora fuligena]|uniref:DUF7730 domain-containing protein n=1 Tax=Pseudocercospora fuligena TaxID=685502 RepID=A0A8H6VMS5_9PEZI|nr:hypothetical protein HII31_00444 [Pseudocercospora fuligena]
MAQPEQENTQIEELGTGFADLSAELRNKIYRLALVLPSSLRLVRAFHKTQGTIFIIHPDQAKSLTPQLLRTNKQIYSEATSILYGENTFRFKFESWLTVFLPKQIPHSVQHLRRIEIVDLNDCFSTMAYFLKPAKNLKNLVLRCDIVEAIHGAKSEDEGADLEEEEFEALFAAGLIQTEDDEDGERSERDVSDENIMPTASYTAKKLQPLAQALYDVQKDKQKVVEIFSFRSWDWLTDEFFETKAAKKLGTKVAECLNEMIREECEGPTCQSGAGAGEDQSEL